MTDFDDKIAKQEAVAQKALDRATRMRTIQRAEAEIPDVWDTGQVTQTALAKTYGISAVTVKRILRDSGRTVTRVKKLSHEERAEAGALIRQNVPIDAIAAQFQVSKNTIRRTGLDLGILTKGERRPRRSDAEYQVIKDFDDDVRVRFGTGMYNLGLGLRTWEAKQRAEARAGNPIGASKDAAAPPRVEPLGQEHDEARGIAPSEPQPVDGVGNDIPPPISEPDTTFTVNDPPSTPDTEVEPETETAPEPAPFRNF